MTTKKKRCGFDKINLGKTTPLKFNEYGQQHLFNKEISLFQNDKFFHSDKALCFYFIKEQS
jgi:hypothetical protein